MKRAKTEPAARAEASSSAQKPTGSPVPDARWHLASSPTEVATTELEFSLFRVFAAFERWQVESMATITHERLTPTECAVLNVVRLKDRRKSPVEIARLLNRDDASNINYAMRKLLALGLIERANGDSNKPKGSTYRATARGIEVTDTYATLRRQVLFSKIPGSQPWNEECATGRHVLDTLASSYEQAALYLATHRIGADPEPDSNPQAEDED